MSDAIKLALDKCEKAAIESGAHESYQIVRESFAELRTALAALRAQPDTTVPDNMQDWKGMDGTIAWHLIERHADNWSDVGKMMGEWLAANMAQPDHIVDASEMVDHSELVKRLRYYATRGMDAYVVAADCDRAADALEGKAIGETK